MMKHLGILSSLLILAMSSGAHAAGGGDYDHANANVHDMASLQRGAAMFANYCMGCHSAQYMRYQRLTEDLGLSEEEVEQFLIGGDQELADYMTSAMPSEQATEWFGVAPPDLGPDRPFARDGLDLTFLRQLLPVGRGWNNSAGRMRRCRMCLELRVSAADHGNR